ncbi:MAG: hypothetical protein ACLPWF_13805 [Bryobacteraceae bacterium]
MQVEVVSSEALTDKNAETRDPAASPDESLDSLARFAAGTPASIPDGLFGLARPGKNTVRPKCLLSESLRKGDGVGPTVALDESCSKLLVVTLDITDVVERTGLTVSVWGSADQIEWGAKPLVTFRQRQYCGVYSVLLNLAMHPEIQHLRVQWNMNRWGRTERVPLFGFEVFVEESGARVSSAALA